MKKFVFSFIDNPVLRENIEGVSVDIFALKMIASLTDRETRNCIRKTVIIYTASIIEAITLWKIQKEVGTKK